MDLANEPVRIDRVVPLSYQPEASCTGGHRGRRCSPGLPFAMLPFVILPIVILSIGVSSSAIILFWGALRGS